MQNLRSLRACPQVSRLVLEPYRRTPGFPAGYLLLSTRDHSYVAPGEFVKLEAIVIKKMLAALIGKLAAER